LDVIVRLKIKGLKSDVLNNWEIIYLPTSTLEYKKVAILRPFSNNNTNHNEYVLEIMAYECNFFQKDFFSKDIIEKSRDKSITLDDVLNVGS